MAKGFFGCLSNKALSVNTLAGFAFSLITLQVLCCSLPLVNRCHALSDISRDPSTGSQNAARLNKRHFQRQMEYYSEEKDDRNEQIADAVDGRHKENNDIYSDYGNLLTYTTESNVKQGMPFDSADQKPHSKKSKREKELMERAEILRTKNEDEEITPYWENSQESDLYKETDTKTFTNDNEHSQQKGVVNDQDSDEEDLELKIKQRETVHDDLREDLSDGLIKHHGQSHDKTQVQEKLNDQSDKEAFDKSSEIDDDEFYHAKHTTEQSANQLYSDLLTDQVGDGTDENHLHNRHSYTEHKKETGDSGHNANMDELSSTQMEASQFLEHVFKRNLGLNESAVDVPVRKRRIGRYLWNLYDALTEDQQRKGPRSGTKSEFPAAIHSVRHETMYLKTNKKVFVFRINFSDMGLIERKELVLDINSFGDGKVFDNSRARVNLYKGMNDTLTVEGSFFENFIIFDISNITDIVDICLERSLFVDDNTIRIKRHFDPMVVIFENLSYNPFLDKRNRRKRQSPTHVWTPMPNQAPTQASRKDACRRYDWILRMDVFNWSWYILPEEFNAGFCSGGCYPVDSAHLNHTNNSYLRSLYHFVSFDTNEEVPKVCCSPIEYLPKSIMYYNNLATVSIKELSNMTVKACGCR